MNEIDRRQVASRRSCALLARDVVQAGHVPNTNIAASVIGALQVQEAIKLLHGQPTLAGSGLHIDGLWNELSRVRYQRRDDCPGHDSLGEIALLGAGIADITLEALLTRVEEQFGAGAVLDLSRDVIVELSCPACETTTPGRAIVGELGEREARCPECGAHRILHTASTVERDGHIDLDQTPAALGLPPFDIVVARQGMDRQQAWLFDGDKPAVLGSLASPGPSAVR